MDLFSWVATYLVFGANDAYVKNGMERELNEYYKKFGFDDELFDELSEQVGDKETRSKLLVEDLGLQEGSLEWHRYMNTYDTTAIINAVMKSRGYKTTDEAQRDPGAQAIMKKWQKKSW